MGVAVARKGMSGMAGSSRFLSRSPDVRYASSENADCPPSRTNPQRASGLLAANFHTIQPTQVPLRSNSADPNPKQQPALCPIPSSPCAC